MLLQRLENLVRVQFQVAHHLAEHVPLHLREPKTHVLVGQQCVVAAASFIEGAVNHALSRLSQLVLRDVEVLHGVLRLKTRNPAVETASVTPVLARNLID